MPLNSEIENLLRRYYAAPSDCGAELAALLDAVRGDVRQRLAGKGVTGDDLDDLLLETTARLIQATRNSHAFGPRIAHYSAYALTIADHAFDDYLRRVRPNWRRLKRQILLLLSHKKGAMFFARWRWRTDWLIGLLRWQGIAKSATLRYQTFQENAEIFCQQALENQNPEQIPLPALLAKLFRWLETPLEINELTTHVAALRRLQEPQTLSLETHGEGMLARNVCAEIADACQQIVESLASETFRAKMLVWIGDLPPRQRVALLLGMARDELLLLNASGQMAGLLEMPPEDFYGFWPRLPLADGAIAAYLALTPKQVSNLRKCARERILRGMKQNRDEE